MRHPHPRLPLDNNRVTVSICSWDSLQSHHLCHGQKSRFFWDKLIPPLIGILIIGIYIKPYYWVDEFIPYYMENNGSLDARVLFFFRWFCFHLHSGNPRGLEGEILMEKCQSSLVGGWTTPIVKNMLVKWDHFPRDRGENKKYVSCHHLVLHIISTAARWIPESKNISTPSCDNRLELLYMFLH